MRRITWFTLCVRNFMIFAVLSNKYKHQNSVNPAETCPSGLILKVLLHLIQFDYKCRRRREEGRCGLV